MNNEQYIVCHGEISNSYILCTKIYEYCNGICKVLGKCRECIQDAQLVARTAPNADMTYCTLYYKGKKEIMTKSKEDIFLVEEKFIILKMTTISGCRE